MSDSLRILQVLLVSLDGLSTGIMMEIMFSGLSKSAKRGGPLFRMLCYWMAALIVCLAILLLRIKNITLFSMLSSLLIILVLNHVLYSRSLPEGFVDFLVYAVTTMTVSIIYRFFHPYLIPDFLSADFLNAAMTGRIARPMIHDLASIRLFSLMAKITVACLIIFWKRESREKMTEVLTVCCFFLIFCCCALIPQAGFPEQNDVLSRSLLMGPQIAVIAGGLICFMFIVFNRTSRDLRESKEYSEIQESYLKLVRQSHEDIEKLRHEYRDFAIKELGLLEKNRIEEALALFETQGRLVRSKKPANYCANRVVNAIVSQKALAAAEAGVILDCHLKVPEGVPVEPLDLCRAVGNLLDNAIRAAFMSGEKNQKGSEDQKEEPVVVFKASLIQNHLLFSCENPCPKNRSRKIYGTGYGQQILRSLAGKYDGDFHTENPNARRYLAVLTLCLDPRKEGGSSMEAAHGE